MEGLSYKKFFEVTNDVYDTELSELHSINTGEKLKTRRTKTIVNKRSRIKQPISDEALKLATNMDISDVGRYTIVETLEENTIFDKDAEEIFRINPKFKDQILPIEYGAKAAWHVQINSPGPFKHGCVLASDFGIIFSSGYPQPPRRHIDGSLWENNLHATQIALLRLEQYEYIFEGSCFLTHLPCPECLKLLSYRFVKEIFYLDVSEDEYLDEKHIAELCNDIHNIKLTKLNKDKIKQLYEQDNNNYFTHYLRSNASDYPCQNLNPEWMNTAIKENPPR